jgi:hypothetical protein
LDPSSVGKCQNSWVEWLNRLDGGERFRVCDSSAWLEERIENSRSHDGAAA